MSPSFFFFSCYHKWSFEKLAGEINVFVIMPMFWPIFIHLFNSLQSLFTCLLNRWNYYSNWNLCCIFQEQNLEIKMWNSSMKLMSNLNPYYLLGKKILKVENYICWSLTNRNSLIFIIRDNTHLQKIWRILFSRKNSFKNINTISFISQLIIYYD